MRPTTPSAPFDRKATIRAVFAPGTPRPRLLPHHSTLLRRLRVMWVPIEEGAPGVDFFQPLIGQRPTIEEAMSALSTTDEAFATRVLAELELLIPLFVQRAGSLAPGRYAIPDEMCKFFAFPDSGADTSGRFELRKEHLVLLKAAQWHVLDSDTTSDLFEGEGESWPMPFIDGKYPYGERSYYQVDMAELLGQPYRTDLDGEVIEDEEKDARLERLHTETLAALQVFLAHASQAAQIII